MTKFEHSLDGQPVSVVVWEARGRIPFDINIVPHQVSPISMDACVSDGRTLLGAAFPKCTFTLRPENLPQIIKILGELKGKKLASKDLAFGLNEDTNDVFISRPYSIVADVEGTLIGTNCAFVIEMFEDVMRSGSSKAIENLFTHLKAKAPLELLLTHPVFWTVSRKEEFLYVLTDRRDLLNQEILNLSSTCFAVNDNWFDSLPAAFKPEVYWRGAHFRCKPGKPAYKVASIKELLVFLRDKKQHFNELDEPAKLLVQHKSTLLMEYFLGLDFVKTKDLFFLVWENFDSSLTHDPDVLQFFVLKKYRVSEEGEIIS